MSFDPNQNHSISLPDASALTAAYRAANPNQLIGGFFGKKAIADILAQSECVGLKFYFAIKNGNPVLVCCGAKADQNDLFDGLLAEAPDMDPPSSSAPNPLNT